MTRLAEFEIRGDIRSREANGPLKERPCNSLSLSLYIYLYLYIAQNSRVIAFQLWGSKQTAKHILPPPLLVKKSLFHSLSHAVYVSQQHSEKG